MRSYAVHLAESAAAASGPHLFSRLSRLYRHWRSRRRLACLWDLDNRLLDDIGLTREDLDRALRLPLGVNATAALERSALERWRQQPPRPTALARMLLTVLVVLGSLAMAMAADRSGEAARQSIAVAVAGLMQ